jgi:hypothetical protein
MFIKNNSKNVNFFSFLFFSFLFFQILFWEYPSGAGRKTPAELKRALGFECLGGLGRGFLSLAKFY